MTCWTVLGIDRDADERAIKRAYAKLLRQHRPDIDPEGFRRINDAYQHALAMAGMMAAARADGPDEDDAPVLASVSLPAQVPAPTPTAAEPFAIASLTVAPAAIAPATVPPAAASPASAAPAAPASAEIIQAPAATPETPAPAPALLTATIIVAPENPPAPGTPAPIPFPVPAAHAADLAPSPAAPPRPPTIDPDLAARAVIAEITTPAHLANDHLERWAFAVIRLLDTAPEALADVDPAVAVAAAGRGKVNEAMGIWQRWRVAGDWQRVAAFAAAWSTDNAGDPRLLRATLDIALAAAITDPPLATRLGDLAFAADPRGAAYWMAAWNFEQFLALGKTCAPLAPEGKRVLAQLFAGGALVPADPATAQLIARLYSLGGGRRIVAAVEDANPEAGAALHYQFDLCTFSNQARDRLAGALASGRWDSRGNLIDLEITRQLALISLPSPLMDRVARDLPDLALNANRQRQRQPRAPGGGPADIDRRVAAANRVHRGATTTTSAGGTRPLWIFFWMLILLVNATRACNSSSTPPIYNPPPTIYPQPYNPPPFHPPTLLYPGQLPHVPSPDAPRTPTIRNLPDSPFAPENPDPFHWPPQPGTPGGPQGPPAPRQ